MNERIQKLAEQAGGEFWQRIESDGLLNKEAYITFDPPQSLEKFAELIVRECIAQCEKNVDHEYLGWGSKLSAFNIKQHFGVEE